MSPFFAQKAAAIILAVLALGMIVFAAVTGPEDLKVFKTKEGAGFFRFSLIGLAVFFALIANSLMWW